MINVMQLNVDVETDLSMQILEKIVMVVGKHNVTQDRPVNLRFVSVFLHHRLEDLDSAERLIILGSMMQIIMVMQLLQRHLGFVLSEMYQCFNIIQLLICGHGNV